MVQLNPFFAQLQRPYIFPLIEKEVEQLRAEESGAHLLNLGVGDVCKPLPAGLSAALAKAAEEMSTPSGMRGYGPSTGYLFLKQAIAAHAYSHVGIEPEEIFISDGTNSDAANLLDLFGTDISLGIPDPTYPVYLDAAILAKGTGNLHTLECMPTNSFAPQPPSHKIDVVYLCSPNNPTGCALDGQELKAWVDWALYYNSLLIVDNVYADFIRSDNVPRTIFEIAGAKKVAIELRSFSKSCGFTGLRCGYAVIPSLLMATLEDSPISLRTVWGQRQGIKSNGVSYPIQRAAAATFEPGLLSLLAEQREGYLRAAALLRQTLLSLGHCCYGGNDAPYVWWQTPVGYTSWEFFSLLLRQLHLICVPGIGFGTGGEGFVRLSGFIGEADLAEAVARLCAFSASPSYRFVP